MTPEAFLMNCEEVLEKFRAFGRGEISISDLVVIEKHIEGCERCSAAIKNIGAAPSSNSDLDTADVPKPATPAVRLPDELNQMFSAVKTSASFSRGTLKNRFRIFVAIFFIGVVGILGWFLYELIIYNPPKLKPGEYVRMMDSYRRSGNFSLIPDMAKKFEATYPLAETKDKQRAAFFGAFALLQMRKYAESRAKLIEIIEVYGDTGDSVVAAEAAFYLAESYFLENNYSAAEAGYNKFLREFGSDPSYGPNIRMAKKRLAYINKKLNGTQ